MDQTTAIKKSKWYLAPQALNLLEGVLSNSLLATTVILIIVYAILGRDRNFFTFENLINILISLTSAGFLTWSMAIAMLAGNIDWSTAGLSGLASVIVAVLFMQNGWGAIPAILATATTCVIFSLLTSSLIVFAKIPSLVASIAVNGIFIAASMYISNNLQINIRRPELVNLFFNSHFLGIPFAFWLMFIFFGIAYVMLYHTSLGAHIYAVGANPVAARLNGVQVNWVIRLTLMWSALCIALAGIIETVRGGITLLYGTQGGLLPMFGPVMLGGISLFGGRGRLENMFIAIVFYTVLNNGLYMFNASSGVIMFCQGLIFLLALMLSSVRDWVSQVKR